MLELKVVADVGLVGFPSAGKSSLIAAISRARPKIADYPFTTLIPNLGVVSAGDTTFTVADVPGLIEGAAEGRGLGHDFLRHIERCAALVHVLDTATLEPGRNPVDDLDVIEAELARYGGLDDRPRLVALNKVDVPDGRDISGMVRRRAPRARAAGLRDLGCVGGGHPRAGLRDGRDRARGAGREGGRGRRADRAAPQGRRRRRVHRPQDRCRLAGPRREAGALGAPDRLQQRRGGGLPRRPAQPARRRVQAARARVPRRATPSSSATPTTRWSSTSSRASTPAPRTSRGAARTSGSRRNGRPTSAAATSRRPCPNAARPRPGPTSRVAWTGPRSTARWPTRSARRKTRTRATRKPGRGGPR